MLKLQMLLMLLFGSLLASDTGGGGGQSLDNDTDDDSDDDDTGTMTRAEADRMAAGARKKGASQARRELAESLGVSYEEAKKIIEAQREHDDANLSEAERARRDAETARAEAETERASARTERRLARVERRLSAAKLNEEMVDDIAAAILSKLADDADDDDIDDLVDTYRAKAPALFTGETGDLQNRGRDTSGPRRKTKTAPTAQGIEAGKELARRRFKSPTERASA